MSKIKAADLKELSVEQLEAKLLEAEEESFRLRFRSATEAIDNPTQFRTLRRNVARIKTVLGQKK
ncbi:MAG: 50S ribosomal protein L29 [Gemmatimonadales bacterium]|nr:50S ribosomal protein L29 [Gemmatimonadales bacterium]